MIILFLWWYENQQRYWCIKVFNQVNIESQGLCLIYNIYVVNVECIIINLNCFLDY